MLGASIDWVATWSGPLTGDRLLVIFYGGLLSGVGLALVFRGRGTTGGADILGRLLQLWLDLPVGQAILGINVVVFGLAARLKRRVGEADPDAFVTIYSPQEVLGAGLAGPGFN